jgi:dTDP-D-glucose 4,6-dehydratase
MMRRRASLNTDQAWRQLLKESQHVATLQLAADDHLARSINSVDLED